MNYFLLVACLVIIVVGCKQDDVKPIATSPVITISGSGVTTTFTASEWYFYLSGGTVGNPNQYESTLITDGLISTAPSNTTLTNVYSYSLGISTETAKTAEIFSYWSAALTPPKGIQVGKSLTLKAKVQLQNIQGKGVSLALRGDRTNQMGVLFATTQGKISLIGTNDFTEYSVTLPYTASVDRILVFLVFSDQTTGKALFKDVSVQVN